MRHTSELTGAGSRDVVSISGWQAERRDDDLQEFFAAAYPELLRLLWCVLRDGDRAEAVAQDAFTELCRGWARRRGHERPELWVRRSALRRGRRDEADEDGRFPDADLGAALRDLPGRDRAIIALHDLERRPLDDVAGLVGCSATACADRLRQGHERLATVLASDDDGEPVDQRLRERLRAATLQLPLPDTGVAWETVTARARATSLRHRTVAVTIASAVAAVAAVALTVPGGVGVSGPDDTQPPSPGPTVAYDLSLREVEWRPGYRSDPFTFADIARTLRTQDLGAWVAPLRDEWGPVAGRIRLEFAHGRLTATIPGTAVTDRHDFSLFPPLLVLEDGRGLRTRFDGTTTESDDGPRLSLSLTMTEQPAVDGIPSEVYLRALYTTVSFTGDDVDTG